MKLGFCRCHFLPAFRRNDSIEIGSARASRAVVGALADHAGAPKPIPVHWLNDAPNPTGEAPVGTREDACAPHFLSHGSSSELVQNMACLLSTFIRPRHCDRRAVIR